MVTGGVAGKAPEATRPAVDARDARGVQVGPHSAQTNNFVQGDYHHHVAAVPVQWPVVVGRPPMLADAFQDRPGLVEAIGTGVDTGSAVITQVVTGDGGTGKTQSAASVFRRALPGLQVAVWVSATSRSAILAAYGQAWGLLRPGQFHSGDAEQDAVAFVGWLEVTERTWMLVLDDVQDPVDVRRLWPSGLAGRVLVTTRRRDPALTGHARTVVDVGVFTPEEASQFLARKLADSRPPGVLDQAAELGEDLGRLPLALAQAGAVILDEAITCAEYRTRYNDRTQQLVDVFTVDTGDEYERTIAGTWSLAIERANGMAPIGVSGKVLQLAAVLDPNGAPDVLFSTPPVLSYLAGTTSDELTVHEARMQGSVSEKAYEVSAMDARRALRNLHRLSLITHDPAGRGRGVRMHALAQRATLEHLTDADLATAVRVAADALDEIWPSTDPDGDMWPVLRANASTLAHQHRDALWIPDAHCVLFDAGVAPGPFGGSSG